MAITLTKKSSGKPATKPVGPGNPPHHTRFKPGQSGNLTGRPKGSKNLTTAIAQELRRKVVLTIDGKAKRMTVQEVIIRQLINNSMKGQHKATELLFKFAMQLIEEGSAGGDTGTNVVLPDKDSLRRIKARIDKLTAEDD